MPRPLQWVIRRTDPGLLHPIEPPSMLAVEAPDHTRYRKLVSSVFTTRAVAALRDRVQDTANALLDDLADDVGTVDIVERYCSQLPVTVIGDILGVPEAARPRILEFGEMGAPSLDTGLTWPQYRRVYRGIEGFNDWLSNHLHELRRNPGNDLMSQIVQASDEGAQLSHEELLAIAGLVLAAGFETTVNFIDPHRFDIERENAGKHLSFSGGRHFCLGAALARAEGEVGLRTFFERFPDARLAGTGSRRETRVLRGWSSLPITLGRARTAVSS